MQSPNLLSWVSGFAVQTRQPRGVKLGIQQGIYGDSMGSCNECYWEFKKKKWRFRGIYDVI